MATTASRASRPAGELDDVGDWNIVPNDYPALPIPTVIVGFDDGEPQSLGRSAARASCSWPRN